MTQTELQTLMDTGGPLPSGDVTLSQPLFVRGAVVGSKTTLHTNNFDALVALPDALRNFDPAPYFPASGGYRTLAHSCIRFLNTPGDWIQNCDSLTISMKLTKFDNGGSIAGLACNTARGGIGGYPPSPWVLTTHPDWGDAVTLKLVTAAGTLHTLIWHTGGIGVEQTLILAVRLGLGTATLMCNGVIVALQGGTIPPAGSKFADNQTSALFLGAVTNQATAKGDWGCCDCTLRDVSITYNAAAFVPVLTQPALGSPLIAYNGGFGYLSPTTFGNLDQWSKGTLVRDLSFVGQDWGAAITVQSALRTRIENIQVGQFAIGAQVLGGPLPNYPVDVVNLYCDHARDTALRLQRCDAVVRNLYADYPRRSVMRADVCGMLTVRDVFQAPEGDHTVTDSIRFDRCCHMDLARMDLDYEDGVGPKNSYIRVVGDPIDTSPPPYLGFTHVIGNYKGIDLTGSPWGTVSGFPVNLINTVMPVRYNV
jgi:hypothetical protein